MFKKTLSITLSVLLMVLLAVVPSFAEDELYPMEDVNQYIRFETPGENPDIASDGSFTFKIRSGLTSGKFKPTNGQVTIKTKAHLEDALTGAVSYSSSKTYRVYLLTWATGQTVSSYAAHPNGNYYSKTFTGLSNSKYYKIKIAITSQGDVNSQYYFVGSGKVSGATVSY